VKLAQNRVHCIIIFYIFTWFSLITDKSNNQLINYRAFFPAEIQQFSVLLPSPVHVLGTIFQ